MDFASKLLDNIFGHHATTFTFKGSGYMSPEDGVKWQAGFDLGYAFTFEHYGSDLKYDCPWPEDWGKLGDGIGGDGFAEGCITGRGVVIDLYYPGLLRMSIRDDGHYDLTFKDGRKIIV